MNNDQKTIKYFCKKVILELDADEVLRMISVLMRYKTDHMNDNIFTELLNQVMNQFDNYWHSYYSNAIFEEEHI